MRETIALRIGAGRTQGAPERDADHDPQRAFLAAAFVQPAQADARIRTAVGTGAQGRAVQPLGLALGGADLMAAADDAVDMQLRVLATRHRLRQCRRVPRQRDLRERRGQGDARILAPRRGGPLAAGEWKRRSGPHCV